MKKLGKIDYLALNWYCEYFFTKLRRS